MYPDDEAIWVGASDYDTEGTFTWTGSQLPMHLTSSWHPTEPNDYGGKQDCVVLWTDSDDYPGTLADLSCKNKYRYFCEFI